MTFGVSQMQQKQCMIPNLQKREDLKDILAAAQASRRKEQTFCDIVTNAERSGYVENVAAGTVKAAEEWLAQLRVRVDEDGRRIANKEQFLAVEKVVKRCIEEMQYRNGNAPEMGEPLRWLVHGGPGTGKSHVIKLVKEFFKDVLHHDLGIEYQIVALQAVMAALLGGDTIHHALGIPCFGRKKNTSEAESNVEVAKRVLQWRWVIIDEISMVSVKLLATIDMKLRSVIRAVGTEKVKHLGVDRSFGGLNVLMCGDLWQLPCPDGGYLGDIPTEFIRNARKYDPSPSIAHGQAILWGGGAYGVQGITELVEC